jgi:hypothetical protein
MKSDAKFRPLEMYIPMFSCLDGADCVLIYLHSCIPYLHIACIHSYIGFLVPDIVLNSFGPARYISEGSTSVELRLRIGNNPNVPGESEQKRAPV